MELIKILSETVVKNIKRKDLLSEAMSEKVIKQMIDKFSGETEGDPNPPTEDYVRELISDFERFKQAFPPDRRDIVQYTYNDLKTTVEEYKKKQEAKKASTETFKAFMDKNKGADINQVKANFKAFDMVKDVLPAKEQNILNYTDVDLNDLIQNQFVPLMVMKRKIKDLEQMDPRVSSQILKMPKERLQQVLNDKFKEIVVSVGWKKFATENPELTPEIVLPRLEAYATAYSKIPFNTKPLMLMTFDEFEHIVDALPVDEEDETKVGIDLDDIKTIYEDDELLVFLPTIKNECIRIRKKYAPNSSWCTSWDRAGNYYYNYRLKQNLTLYYVIDLTQPANYRTHPNHAGVVLVDRYGDKRLADATNSGRWSGGQTVSWNEITEKFPLLKGKEDLFKPLPISDEDREHMNRIESARVSTDAIKELGSEAEAELWLELVGPDLSNRSGGSEIYKNLTPELKKKYIGLSLPLNAQMVQDSEPDVVAYYLREKVKQFENKSLKELTELDIALINSPLMKKHKEKIREIYTKEIEFGIDEQFGGSSLEISYPSNINAKFSAIFGLEKLFASVKDKTKITYVSLENTSKGSLYLDLPNEIAQFTNLQMLIVDNYIKSIPEAIGQCKFLVFLNLLNCPRLTKLPKSIVNLTCLEFLSTSGSGIDENSIPESAKQYFIEDEFMGYVQPNFPPEMKQHCPATFDF
jgi:hypothetical protein